jgi:flagellar motor switch/type III secretory pathway protein FliN
VAQGVAPYPWGSLDAVRKADAEALLAMRRLRRPEGFARALASIVGANVRFLLRRAQPLANVPLIDDAVAVMLAPASSADLAHALLLEAEGALASSVVSRALKRTPPSVTNPSHPASPNVAGALAAIVVAAARKGDEALRVLAAGPGPVLVRDFARAHGELLLAAFTVTVDDDAFLARVMVPRQVASLAKPRPFEAHALGDTPLDLAIVANVSLADPHDIAALAPGDAWIPSDWTLDGLAGPVLVAAPELEMGVTARLEADGRLVLGGEVKPLSWSTQMDETKEALVESVGEAPVVVRVEVGAARMRAREWAELMPGDVVALGRKIAEPVVLRVAGLEVARGELVQIDGEIGVRILERLDRKETVT